MAADKTDGRQPQPKGWALWNRFSHMSCVEFALQRLRRLFSQEGIFCSSPRIRRIMDYYHPGAGSGHYPERRSGKERRGGRERRSGKDRRKSKNDLYLRSAKDRRSGLDRRSGQDRRRGLRIPIFVKLTALSLLLIFLIISITSFLMLNKQRGQFIDQLMNLGESMVHIAVNNAPEKLLGEEDLALFQLLNDIAENEQVVYALITDQDNIVKAHTNIEELSKVYLPPDNMIPLKEDNGMKVSSLMYDGEELLFFEKPIIYQELKVGEVRLAISQKKILQNISDAKRFVLFVTVVTVLLGILSSLGLSMYISWPIHRLRESTKSLGAGDFSHRIFMKRKDEFGDLCIAFNKMTEDMALKEMIKDSFGRYVAPEVVDLILANPDNQWMKGLKVEATVLFVDIRGFTALSEGKDPEVIVELLNGFFTRVTDIVMKYGGYLNKFVGDEVMAVFGTPTPDPLHAEAAVRAALEIQRQIVGGDFKKEMGDLSFHVGIGINSGEMVAGNLGSAKRVEYTVIGDNVNVSARLTGLAKGTEILISWRTYELIRDKSMLKVEERGLVSVKGRKTELSVFNVLGFEEANHVEHSQEPKLA
ncbi:MAG: adenylate/guanylate cyclase domain-containing protein [Thermodesulfobacteriota bacterium]|nr:adenylate/guanylate cyclase domain-containing protein [Thermodesulfobacteriota bacterium]